MPIYYIPILVMFLVLFIVLRHNKLIIIKKIISKKKNTEEKSKVVELAKRFIGKECLIYSFDGHQYDGVIKEVEGGAVLIEKNGELQAINLDFVIRIREYPKNSKGKKKSVVLD